MPGFVIFVFVLTFAYVVYFSVMITLDLHRKKTDEETIDVSSMDNEEVPVSVEEHNDGPEGSDMTYTEQVTDDGLRVVIPTGNKQTNSSPPEEEESKSTQQTTTTEELNKENEENMEEIEPAPQYCFYPDEFMQNLNDKHNKRKIEKRNAIDKL